MQAGEPFGRLVKELRKALDLTQENLANKVGCAVITIARIEGETLRILPMIPGQVGWGHAAGRVRSRM